MTRYDDDDLSYLGRTTIVNSDYAQLAIRYINYLSCFVHTINVILCPLQIISIYQNVYCNTLIMVLCKD